MEKQIHSDLYSSRWCEENVCFGINPSCPAAVSLLPSGAYPLSGVSDRTCCPGIADEGICSILSSPALPLDPHALHPSATGPKSATGPAAFPQGLLRGLNPGPGGSKAGVDVWSLGDIFSAS